MLYCRDDGTPKKKKKKKAKKLEVSECVPPEVQPAVEERGDAAEETASTKKKKKRKRKSGISESEATEVGEVEGDGACEEMVATKKKRKRKREGEVDDVLADATVEESTPEVSLSKQKKKRLQMRD